MNCLINPSWMPKFYLSVCVSSELISIISFWSQNKKARGWARLLVNVLTFGEDRKAKMEKGCVACDAVSANFFRSCANFWFLRVKKIEGFCSILSVFAHVLCTNFSGSNLSPYYFVSIFHLCRKYGLHCRLYTVDSGLLCIRD